MDTARDGASASKYTYQGNWTTVVEPDTGATPFFDCPTRERFNRDGRDFGDDLQLRFSESLSECSMPRGSVTQTRTFVYDPVTLRLTSMTSPETGAGAANGTTSYTYNADGTVATRTDPAGQVTKYTYDSYQRVG